jgi:N-methylhydantoinase A
VTDANLLLGRLQPTRFLGGDFTLDLERTRRVTLEWLTKQGSHLTLEKFAVGVVRVVNATMEKAIRVVSIERGRDPRRFTLVAFGGAGGLHACALADALSIPHVIVPAFPGALSALGILWSDVVKDYSRTVLWRVSREIPLANLNQAFSELQQAAAQELSAEGWDGTPRFSRTVDLRYRGQGYELNLSLTRDLLREFEAEHRRRYGYTHAKREIEIVTLRLRAVLRSSRSHAAAVRGTAGRRSATETRVVFDGGSVKTKIYTREDLGARKTFRGPAIVTEYSATTVVPPGKKLRIDNVGNLIIAV